MIRLEAIMRSIACERAVRAGFGMVCAAVLFFSAGVVMGDDGSREAFIKAALQEPTSESGNAELTPVPATDFGIPAAGDQTELRGDLDPLRAILEDCDHVGAFSQAYAGPNLLRGNMFDVAEPEIMTSFAIELNIAVGQSVDLCFALYDKVLGGSYCLVFNEPICSTVIGRGRDFYSSSESSGPFSVELSPAKFYLAAVAWGNTTVIFGLENRPLPIDYAKGTIFFSTTKNGVTIPDDLEGCPPGLPNINSEVYSMQLCFKPPPGACCVGTTCVDDVENELACTQLGGEWTAPGIPCSAVDGCPLPMGRCCLGPNSCIECNQYECLDDLGGDRWFPGETCAQYNDCFDPQGACCQFDGTCVNTTETQCDDPDAVYMGDFVMCSPDVQCEVTGACCLPLQGCLQRTEADCLATTGAVYHGDGTHCQELPDFPLDPCVDPAPTGACCFYDGTCQITTEYECEVSLTTLHGDTAGVWHEGTSCGAAACQQLGACCNDTTGACTNTVLDSCDTAGVTWYEGVPCEYDPCSDLGQVGACCKLGDCSILNSFDCAQIGGIFTDVGTNAFKACSYLGGCTDGLGACCLPDDSCVLATEGDCTAGSGDFQAVGEDCSVYSCLTGACCFSAGDCQQLEYAECVSQGGQPGDPGSECPLGDDPCLGACCLGDSCGDLIETDCESYTGEFQGLGTSCATGGCDTGACCSVSLVGGCGVTTEATCNTFADGRFHVGESCEIYTCVEGACCTTNGVCEVLREFECTLVSGNFQGEFTTCEAGACDLGACCPGDGTACVENLYRFECEAGDGMFSAGDYCSTNGIDGLVCEMACCLPDGGCSDLLRAECESAGGVPQPGDTCATPGVCAPGACCRLEAFCSVKTVGECAADDGVFSGPGTTCTDPGVCAPEDIGACCLDGSVCEDDGGNGVSEYYCLQTLNGWFVDDSCVNTPCQNPCDQFPGTGNGDFDGDGDVDLDDFESFPGCMSGPNPAAGLECQCSFDFDSDDDVDLKDYSGLTYLFVGCGSHDYDADRDVDLDDFTAFADCLAGPNASPNPVTADAATCLCAFDSDTDADLDLSDFSAFQCAYTGSLP
ncbi:MAG: hypothetical protein JSV19_05485 [Phycisphaerales bacterium]|nr:MAG: hypothetical protein JSV19_05485 [Phycisphaerales bacterium]